MVIVEITALFVGVCHPKLIPSLNYWMCHIRLLSRKCKQCGELVARIVTQYEQYHESICCSECHEYRNSNQMRVYRVFIVYQLRMSSN
jgi:hypothetical protein